MIFSTDLTQLALVSPQAAAFVQANDLAALPCGRHELADGDFVNVMTYTPKPRPEACYESHEAYVDIQMVIDGTEILEVAPVEALTVTSPYSSEGDCALYSGETPGERFVLAPGRWCLVMPNDAHMPGVAIGRDPAPVKKAVFKVRVDHLR